MPPTDTTPDSAAIRMRLYQMVDNQMYLVRRSELRDVIHAAQAVCDAESDYFTDDAKQYPYEVLEAVDLLRERITALVGDKP